jgi:hypothetical protein
MNVFYANCKYENWDACKKHQIFGLKKANLPNIETGDLILLRVTGHSGQPYGVRAMWTCRTVERVEKSTFVPWTDGPYQWIVRYDSVAELSRPFSEEFATSSKISQKIDGLYATRLMGSMGELKQSEASAYLQGILNGFGAQLKRKASGNAKSTYDVIQGYLQQLRDPLTAALPTAVSYVADRTVSEKSLSEEKELRQPSFGVVGERIDLPVLNYAPLNEMGVILLFGYYMKDLGFSHLEEIRTDFPDAIGMQKIDAKRYRRVRIEFEYKSRNFLIHGHTLAGCDVIICWEHNWPDCPIEVIELQTALFSD